MAKPRNALNWLASAGHFVKEQLGIEKPRTPHPKSIVERLEGLIPPVDLIEKSYKVDRHIAEAHHDLLLAAEKLTVATLKKQQHAIETSELLLDQQAVTADVIDIQVNKQLNAETIIQNFRIFLTEDEATVTWILEHLIEPALFGASFANLEPGWQRKLFNSLRTTVNSLQKEHGMLVEPRHDASVRPKGQTATG